MFQAHPSPLTHEHDLLASPLVLSVSSPDVQMPTVFVHPPEDEAMPWCAFDANKKNATSSELVFTTPEMEQMQTELDDWPQTIHPTTEHGAPAFHRSQAGSTVIMPRRGSTSHPSLSRGRNPLGLASIPESPKRPKERDDDDIVEVMKVRRGEGMLDVAHAHASMPTLRRSKTLRSRAAQALRSIKNAGKAPRRSALEQVYPVKENGNTATKTKAPPPPPPPPPAPTPAPPTAEKHRPKTQPTSAQSSMPRLKKRVSQPLSNLFGLGLGNSEAASAANASDSIGVGVSPSHSGGFRTLPYSRSASASTPTLQLLSNEPARPISPSTSFSIRGTRHKFSFVNLQSIFSGSTRELVPEPQQQVSESIKMDDPSPPRTPQTPFEEGWDSGEDYDSPRRNAVPRTMQSRHSDEHEGLYPEQEISFEMRLNSLHFDSFSFDAEEF